MAATTVLQRGPVSVTDYRCGVGPEDAAFEERHGGFVLAYVRTGSFGYRVRGGAYELVAGSVLIGHPGDEFTCSHEHVYGDECLSFELAPALVETLGERPEICPTACLSPLSHLMVLAQLAHAP